VKLPRREDLAQSLRSILESPRLHAPLFLLVALQFAIHRPMSGNEIDTLQAARRFADPQYIPGDWFLGQPPGPRLPFQVLIWPLTAALPFVPLAIVGRLLGFGLLTGALAKLLGRLGLRLGEAVLVLGAFLWFGQSLFAGEWLFGQFETKVFAYALVLLAFDFAASARLRQSALCLGAATTLHVFVGGWATLACALALLTIRPWPAPRVLLQAALMWLGASLPGLLCVLAVANAHRPSGPDFAWIYVDLRAPHHLLPTTWSLPASSWLLAAGLMAGLFASQRLWPDRAEARVLARLTLATLAPCLLGVLAALSPATHRFLATYPFRVGASLPLLLGLALVVVPLLRRVPTVLRQLLFLAIAILTTFAAARAGLNDVRPLRTFARGGQNVQPPDDVTFDAACEWLRQQPDRALLLTSPAHEAAGYLSERPVIVTFKQIPPGEAGTLDWYARILALAGSGPLQTRSYALPVELDARFEALPPGQYCQLAQAYQARWLLVRRTDLPGQPSHSAGIWRIYALPALCATLAQP
jgi:hypothetical protein